MFRAAMKGVMGIGALAFLMGNPFSNDSTRAVAWVSIPLMLVGFTASSWVGDEDEEA
jgi:hypothetical protein